MGGMHTQPCFPGREECCCLSQLSQVHNSSIIQHRLGQRCDRRHRGMAFRQVHGPEIICFALGRARPRHRRLHLRSGLRGRHHVHGITALTPVIPVTAPRESPASWCPTTSLFVWGIGVSGSLSQFRGCRFWEDFVLNLNSKPNST
jgi:hypothetical protein